MKELESERFVEGGLIPGTVYRVISLIGRGGMGSVYQVEHVELGRIFVLKALHEHLASRADLVGRMKNEWRALGRLNHPNIVQVTDAGQTTNGLPYFVMESLSGVTLGSLLAEKGKLPLKQGCDILVDVLKGLDAAHATGAVHRDIKPPNIFVTDEGATKLLDFGIAKLRDRQARVVTAGGISSGTPRYMAPEQAEGMRVDGRADIYASALVLYESLVGHGPFAHIKDANHLVMAHIGEEPERADWADPRIPPELGDLIQRWLSKSRDSRPRTAELAARELSALSLVLPEEQEMCPMVDPTETASYEAATFGGMSSRPGQVEDLEGKGSRRSAGDTTRRPPESANKPPGGKTETLKDNVAQEPLTSTETFEEGRGEASSHSLSTGESKEVRNAAKGREEKSPGNVKSDRGSLRTLVGVTVVSFAAAWWAVGYWSSWQGGALEPYPTEESRGEGLSEGEDLTNSNKNELSPGLPKESRTEGLPARERAQEQETGAMNQPGASEAAPFGQARARRVPTAAGGAQSATSPVRGSNRARSSEKITEKNEIPAPSSSPRLPGSGLW